MLQYSLSTFVYYRYPLHECLKRIKNMGYAAAEIWGGRPHAYFEDMTDARILMLRKKIASLELQISSFIPAQFRYPTNLASTDEFIRKNSVDYIRKSIDVAEKLGSPYVSICPGYSMYGDKPYQAEDALSQSITELIAYATNMNTLILIEPAHPMETDLVITVQDAIKLIDRFGKDKLGLCVDTGHLFINKESLSDVCEKTRGYVVHYHLDDNFGLSDDHLVPGEGKIDFSAFLNNLQRNNYSGYIAVELGFGYTHDPDPAAQKSIAYLNEVEIR